MPFWLLITLAVVGGAIYQWKHYRDDCFRNSEAGRGLVLLEVMYKGAAIAQVSNPKYADMFWESYDIVPLNDEGRKLIDNDELWDSCQFYFRDLKTGKECKGGFAAGPAPFVKQNKVTLRGLYTWVTPKKSN